MNGEVTAEQARKILDMLTEGGALENVNTSLALRLIPLAEELDDEGLIERLVEHALEVSQDEVEKGWANFEIMKLQNSPIEDFAELSSKVETLVEGSSLSAAIMHHLGLLYLAQENYSEAKLFTNRSLRLRESIEDEAGIVYGLALLEACCKRENLNDEAIIHGTRRLEILMKLGDLEGQIEAMSDLAHTQATVGSFDAAQDLYNQSLKLSKELEDVSGQLVASWGLADIAEISEDYQTAMLLLSDCLHAFIALGIPAPPQVRDRIEALANLGQPSADSE
jgi:tetratricopeptide (TPR) repeat protein